MKKEHGIALDKDFKRMNEAEKEYFIFGDKEKTVIYNKEKTYHWDGANTLLNSNISHVPDIFTECFKALYQERTCPRCKGMAMSDSLLTAEYNGLKFEDAIFSPVVDLYDRLNKKPSKETEIIRCRLKEMKKFGLGRYALGDHLRALDIGQLSIVQYLSYKFSPLYNTAILWDDFSSGKDTKTIEDLIDDLKHHNNNGITVVLAESACDLTQCSDNNIILRGLELSLQSQKHKANRVTINDSNGGIIIDRLKVRLHGGTSIATISDTISKVRNLYKKKNKGLTYSLATEDARCKICGGNGYYEINTGKLGIMKMPCLDCSASGFSVEVLSEKINGKNIANIQSMVISEVTQWLASVGLKECGKNLSVFKKLGLSDLQYGKPINEVSYSQATLMLLGKFILGDDKALAMKNAFLNILQSDLLFVQQALDELCVEYNKTIRLFLP